VVQEVTKTFGDCKTCGHSQIVHLMSRSGECLLRSNRDEKTHTGDKCPCKIFTPNPSEKEQHNGK